MGRTPRMSAGSAARLVLEDRARFPRGEESKQVGASRGVLSSGYGGMSLASTNYDTEDRSGKMQ